MNKRSMRALERIKEEVTPVDKEATIDWSKPYLVLDNWIKEIDERLLQVEKILNEEGLGYVRFEINTNFQEDWSCIAKDEDSLDGSFYDLLEKIYAHINVYVPLMIYAINEYAHRCEHDNNHRHMKIIKWNSDS